MLLDGVHDVTLLLLGVLSAAFWSPPRARPGLLHRSAAAAALLGLLAGHTPCGALGIMGHMGMGGNMAVGVVAR